MNSVMQQKKGEYFEFLRSGFLKLMTLLKAELISLALQ